MAPTIEITFILGMIKNAVIILINVTKVVLALPKNCTIWVKRHPSTLWIHEVVGWSVRIFKQDLAKFSLTLY